MPPSGAAKAAFLSGNETRTEKETDGPRLYGKVLVSVKRDNTPQARTGCQSEGGGCTVCSKRVCVLEATFGNFNLLIPCVLGMN